MRLGKVVIHRPKVELVDDGNFGGPQQVQEEADCNVGVSASHGGGDPVKSLYGWTGGSGRQVLPAPLNTRDQRFMLRWNPLFPKVPQFPKHRPADVFAGDVPRCAERTDQVVVDFRRILSFIVF